jgi:DNA-directed RNA polymerase subunit RPC12/RpoP
LLFVTNRSGGPYELYCYGCNRWVPNTANPEMRKETYLSIGFSHNHLCGIRNKQTIILGDEGIPGIDDITAFLETRETVWCCSRCEKEYEVIPPDNICPNCNRRIVKYANAKEG